MRSYQRNNEQFRPFSFITNFNIHAEGSLLIGCGNTKIICNASVEAGVPSFLRGTTPASGWVTAEYSMLPRATNTRHPRDSRKGVTPPRTIEIQRLISRSLRGAIDLTKIADFTIIVDCDVIQADGGTRTTSITGGYVALALAVNNMLQQGLIKENPLLQKVAGLSLGIKDGQVLCDLDYQEDSNIDADINIVFNEQLQIIEIQGTAEQQPFDAAMLQQMFELIKLRGPEIFALQDQALQQLI